MSQFDIITDDMIINEGRGDSKRQDTYHIIAHHTNLNQYGSQHPPHWQHMAEEAENVATECKAKTVTEAASASKTQAASKAKAASEAQASPKTQAKDWSRLQSVGSQQAEGWQQAEGRQQAKGRQQAEAAGASVKPLTSIMTDVAQAQTRLRRLHQLIDGHTGQYVALVVACAMELGWFTHHPSYRQMQHEFGNIGSKSNYHTQLHIRYQPEEKAPILRKLSS